MNRHLALCLALAFALGFFGLLLVRDINRALQLDDPVEITR